eukprot:CAMPEP_0204116314 /NCGR_PEP_ID=MMETSP0361-20130328/5326_1 /ASSEMBLY_ACC=CAM_ASM_000343 /TAXON_ID=268821 /ORGANISM="Scrippsiella Hangoei, Strain SHTV-5" /LENGTH=288 /DNA_ID=CAMNT_0051067083 /DNA_START=298 /DNA_END=1166 /DNA_ORIENTATION=-
MFLEVALQPDLEVAWTLEVALQPDLEVALQLTPRKSSWNVVEARNALLDVPRAVGARSALLWHIREAPRSARLDAPRAVGARGACLDTQFRHALCVLRGGARAQEILLGLSGGIRISVPTQRHLHLPGPIVVVVIAEASGNEEALEEAPQVAVVRGVLERQAANVPHIDRELLRETLAKLLDGDVLLLPHHRVVLEVPPGRLVRGRLPRQVATQEVEQDVPQGLQVVPAALLDSGMRVDAHEALSPNGSSTLPQLFVLLFDRVQPCPDKAKVDQVHGVGAGAQADGKI